MGARRAVAVILAVAAALAGCGGGKDGADQPSSPGDQRADQNPFTGDKGVPDGPVIGVKIDNDDGAEPHAGINDADLVYVEEIEGGTDRLLAIFASQRPTTVGPVRSVRASDPELLGQYGPIALAFSGGARRELDIFAGSPLVDASFDARTDAYHRDDNRAIPHNLFVDVNALAPMVGEAAGAKDIGLRFSDDDSGLDSAMRVSELTGHVGQTPVSFRQDGDHWVWTKGGEDVTDADGDPVTTPNVLVQFCEVETDFEDIDTAGNPSALTHTVGSGRAVLFRDGRMVDGRWSRGGQGDPTRFVDGDGEEMRLHTGGAWILLARTDSALDTH